jgi:hypothetical protein
MPGPASHITLIELQTLRAQNQPQTYAGAVIDALVNHRKHAALGAIGPDMIFWADWGEYTPVVNTIFDIYKTIDEVYEELAAIWQPIGDAIDKTVNTLTGGLANELSETVALLEGIIQSAIIKLITDQIDVLSFLKPDMQVFGSQSKVKDWNWLDYTHHRWTGEFGRALVRRAHQSSDASLRAYALGWLSHVTADVVGHPYVNTAVGGPYRSHWQRHFIQEKFMDTWVWGFYHPGGLVMPASVLPGEIPFDYSTWTNINGSSLHALIDVGNDMPVPLQKLIVQALGDVYLPKTHPNVKGTIPFLKEEHINRAYQMLFTGLEIMTSKDRFLPRPEPPSVFNDDAPPTFPTPGGGSGGGSGGSSGGSFSLAALLLAILDFIKDLFEYIHDLLLWLVSQITFPLTYPIRYALYLLQLALYEIYRQYRWALCLSGYAYPDPDQLFNPLAQQFINPMVAVAQMPRREFPAEQENCLFFPAGCPLPATPGCVEPDAATSGPYTRFPLNYPYWFIEGEPTSEAIEKALADADTPEQTIDIIRGLFPSAAGVTGPTQYNGSLGSAIDFFLRRAKEVAADNGGESQLKLPDWNLDGDRGYGFKCWQVTANDLEVPPGSGVDIKYNPDLNQP